MIYTATCVASAEGHAVLITGAPGQGKSSLAMLLMDRGWALVSDDKTRLDHEDGKLNASPASHINGLIEIRNLGIVAAPQTIARAPVLLHIALDNGAPRFIESAALITLLDVPVPSIALYPDLTTAALKTEYALRLYGKRD